MGEGANLLVHHRKAGRFPVFERSLVVHLRRGDPAVADAPLHRLNGTFLFQGLGDESRPGGMRPNAQGQAGFYCVAHKEVVHLLAG